MTRGKGKPRAPPADDNSDDAVVADSEEGIEALANEEVEPCIKRRVSWRIIAALLCAVLSFVMYHGDSRTLMNFIDEVDRPGKLFDKSRVHMRKPVVLVPGVISSALEIWEARECLATELGTSTFRQRMFSSASVISILRNPQCFLDHFSLDPATGGDPVGVRVRPDSSFSSADYVLYGYWVWAKVILNLADIGYHPNNMFLASYDWRLDGESLERRDRYFTRLKFHIETAKGMNDGLKAVLVSHSYGGLIVEEFLNWANHLTPGWCDTFIDSFVNIGGPILGAPKAVAGLLSGEMKDTAMLPTPIQSALNAHVSQPARSHALRTWPCMISMIPRGPKCAWPQLLALPRSNDTDFEVADGVQTVQLLRQLLNDSGHFSSAKKLKESRTSATPSLPNARSMTVYCFYGIGRESETGYVTKEGNVLNTDFTTHSKNWTHPLYRVSNVVAGVQLVDGDGTVPLLSLGYACRSRLSYRKTVKEVRTVEFRHQGSTFDVNLRGGVATADHVDIMGNYEMITNLLDIVTGNEENVNDRILSNIDTLVNVVDSC